MREERVESFYARLWESVKASCLSPLFIFPSTSDVDSLCAFKTIFHILESDSVRYSCYPVSSFQEIREYAGSDLSSSSEEPVTILLINWGCHRDLQKDLKLGPAARVFVVDSHRPIHLHNLSDQNDQVVVLYTNDDERLADWRMILRLWSWQMLAIVYIIQSWIVKKMKIVKARMRM